MNLLRFDVPVTPDPDTARQWVTNELSGSTYQSTGDNWWQRFITWLNSLFDQTEAATSTPPRASAVLIFVLVAVVVIIAAYFVTGPIRANRKRRDSAEVLGTDDRDAGAIRGAAEEYARAGAWPAAVLERFRALVRLLEERTIIDERPGRTAREVSADAAIPLPDLVAELAWAGDRFDQVYYGRGGADEATYRRLVELDDRVRHAKPRWPDPIDADAVAAAEADAAADRREAELAGAGADGRKAPSA